MDIGFLIKNIITLPYRFFSGVSVFALIKNSTIDNKSTVLAKSRIYNSRVGKYTYIAGKCTICNTKIGNFCSIAANCIISPGKHPINHVSTSPVFYSKKNVLNKCFNEFKFDEYDETVIGNDVWIGINAFIKGGISIGDGAVIGAYAVVTRDVEPYSIVGGNPAKVIRKRFDNEVIEQLLKSKWWDDDDATIQRKALYFNDVNLFINEYNKE